MPLRYLIGAPSLLHSYSPFSSHMLFCFLPDSKKKFSCLQVNTYLWYTCFIWGFEKNPEKKSILCRHCLCLVRGSVLWLHYIYNATYFSYHFNSQAGLPVRPTQAGLWCGTGVPCMFIGWTTDHLTGKLTHILGENSQFLTNSPQFCCPGPNDKEKRKKHSSRNFSFRSIE